MGQKVVTPCADLEVIDARIRWVLEHPDMSPWLKSALRSALVEDPIDLTNDLQILSSLIASRSSLLMRQSPCDDGRS
ncbi:hypothetical protein [Brevundimonas sp.]|uniref:hypothetical protein n=1 Tax=Brevundimonas sp. TaxID=1871086 RepID=UPI00286A9F45|nr:hypothetical protein [Brevundimonas sp.]